MKERFTPEESGAPEQKIPDIKIDSQIPSLEKKTKFVKKEESVIYKKDPQPADRPHKINELGLA